MSHPNSQPEISGDDWLIMSRGLYFRPGAMGYTGIRDHAGRYSHAAAQSYAVHGECTIVLASEAAEFLPAAYSDLVIKHLTKQRDELRAQLDARSGVQISDEMVNAGARELWNDRDARHGGPWDQRDAREICVIQTKATMRAALQAALALSSADPS